MNPDSQEKERILARIHELKVEHRDLDQIITHLTANPPPDELLVLRLKKRKLQIKDRLMLLEQLLVPNIPA